MLGCEHFGKEDGKKTVVKEGITHTVAKNIITPMENIHPTPVVTNQSAVASRRRCEPRCSRRCSQ